MKIPFADIKRQYLTHQASLDGAMARVMADTAFIGGLNNKYVAEFEQNFASYLGINHCVSCANGTDSLEIAMKALGIGPGDEVIVPVHSWISTSESVSAIGATPVFADTLPHLYTIDPADVARKITDRTKAIIPVHLYGLPAEMDAIMALAGEYGLWVIEDCAQAHGATYKGKMTGSFGHAASFSFYPGKNLGAFGDAGAMVTNDEVLADKMRMIANHGQLTKHRHQMEGRNSRMDGLQAAVLTAKLPHLSDWTEKRRQIARHYFQLLKDVPGVQLPQVPEYSIHVYHLYVIEIDQRNQLMNFLADQGVATAIHYPALLPQQPAYAHFNHGAPDFPGGNSYISNILSLPMFPELTEGEIEYVAQKIKEFFKN